MHLIVRATYQQIGVPNMHDTDAIMALRDELGDAAWTHHEFCKFADEVAAIDLPIVRRTTNGFPMEIAFDIKTRIVIVYKVLASQRQASAAVCTTQIIVTHGKNRLMGTKGTFK